jgi:probable HAF family extracellular repeat protein
MQDLGTLRPEDKHKSSRAEGINDLGQVVGSSEIVTNEGGGDRAFLWTADGGMQDLGALPGATFSYATDINERGEVVGASQTAGGEGHAFLWTQADGFKDLGTLGGSSSAAQAINDLGHVVGGIDAHAFLWTAESGMKDLGKPPGSDLAFAFDINTLGQVVVLSVTSGLNQAFVWTQADGFQELVTLGGNYSQALAINERGQVAGSSSTAGGEAHAVVWQLTTSPTAALAALADNVAALARAGKLTRGEAHALGAKLDQVARLLERGKHKTAGNVLGAFVNQVEALIRSGRLARSDGQPLRDAASCIIARLREGVGE